MLEASTPAGKAYNVVIFGAILLSVLALLLEPDPGQFSPAPNQCALDRSGSERLFGGVCGGFRPSSGLGGEASPLPVQLHRTD